MNPQHTWLAAALLFWSLAACRAPATGPGTSGAIEAAPEIEGIDLDGVPFKLSDYRGKVVFLDFWGDW